MTAAPAAVTMYTTTWCGYCVRLKKLMQREGIDYAEVDIEQDPAAADLVMQANGGQPHRPDAALPRRQRPDQPEHRPGEGPARAVRRSLTAGDLAAPLREGA
jgi:mycoredoxin